MKITRFLAAGLLPFWIVAFWVGMASAATVTIFSDNFDRSDSAIVGNNWGPVGDASISGNRLLLDNSYELATQQGPASGGLSTVGLTNIILEFDWQGVNTEGINPETGGPDVSTDWLYVSWRPLSGGPAAWQTAAPGGIALDTSLQHYTAYLPLAAAGIDDLQFQFMPIFSDDQNEQVYIDNVTLTAVPLPGALPLLLSALIGLFFVSRQRKT